VLAIYPSWWGDFPLWFGRRVDEVPVRGNVICGGASKVLYAPRWESLDKSEEPFSLREGERRVASLDLADLVSERQRGYRWSNGAIGHVLMKLLPNPTLPREDLWDAGRVVPPGVRESPQLVGTAQPPDRQSVVLPDLWPHRSSLTHGRKVSFERVLFKTAVRAGVRS
jgi:hypothetical protein